MHAYVCACGFAFVRTCVCARARVSARAITVTIITTTRPNTIKHGQTLNEKIEERNEELHKLRKKTTTTVQVLTHIKEKLQFVQVLVGRRAE